MRALLLAFATICLANLMGSVGASPLTAITCSGAEATARLPYSVDVGGETADGMYAYPASTPKALVALQHGWGGRITADNSYGIFLRELAKAGALAVAMDYRGDQPDYKVFAGAQDTAAAIRDLQAQCGPLPVILWGISMGGHVSGLTAMQNPGIADILVMDVGVANVPEFLATWAPGALSFYATAGMMDSNEALDPKSCGITVENIEDESCRSNVGRYELILEAYGLDPTLQSESPESIAAAFARMAETSPALNQNAWRGSGLDHAYLVYGSADAIVTPDQGLQLFANLRSQEIPSTFYLAAYHGVTELPCKVPEQVQTCPDHFHQPPGYLGITPAIHASYGFPIVKQLVAKGPVNDDLGIPVGVTSGQKQDLVKEPMPVGPPPPVAEPVDEQLAPLYDDIAEMWNNLGPVYPSP